MIIISEVAVKLEKILNDLDLETSDKQNPTSFYFQVETEGFHIDHIKARDRNQNFIPVYISSLGGQYNPVKGLKQASYVIPIVFYYPVRFKNDFFALGEMLSETFVGEILNYGPISGKAVSNISVPTFGEIQNMDFQKFESWLSDHNFPKFIEETEPYMSMQVNLYLSNSASGFIYGNDIKIDFSFKGPEGVEYEIEDIDWDGASLQSNAQASPEQEENAEVPETQAFPFGTSYGSSFKIYPNFEKKANATKFVVESGTYDPNAIYYRKNGDTYTLVGQLTESEYDLYHSGGVTLYIEEPCYFYKELLKVWLEGKIQEVGANITFTIGDPSWGLVYTRPCFIQSIVAPIEKGQIFSITLTFAKRIEDEE